MEEGRQYRIRMNPNVFEDAASSTFFEELKDPNSSTLLQVTIGKNNVLHVALQSKNIDAAKNIVNLSPRLVYETNSKGNTPLHVATMVGDSSLVELLIKHAKELDVETGGRQLLSMVNLDGDTALHVAVRYDNDEEFKIVKELIKEDEELAKHVNNAGESALFLAVDRQHYNMASHILSVAPNCSYAGRHNMNVLHALVLHTSCINKGDLLLKEMERNEFDIKASIRRLFRCFISVLWIINRLFRIPIPEFAFEDGSKEDRNRIPWDKLEINPNDLVKEVMRNWPSTIEQGDDSGWTPLHIAAHLGNWRLVELLLENDNSRAYARNKEGLSALHIAAKENDYRVVTELMAACPDISELLDNRGRNALHAAAESGGWKVVVYFRFSSQFEGLINEKDKEGNTPLHLAVINGHYWIAHILLEDGLGVDTNATDEKGITPMDYLLLRKQLPSRPTMPLSSKGPPQISLMKSFIRNLFPKRKPKQRAGNDNDNDNDNRDGVSISDLMKQIKMRKSSKGDRLSLKGALLKVGIQNLGPKSEPKLTGNDDGNGNGNGKGTSVSDFWKEVSETNLLVATLITTVTFTAAFTVPGGYNQNGSVDEGLAVLSKRTAFGVFLIANTLAFGFSTTSVLIHFLLASDTTTEDVFHSEVIQRAPLFTTWSIGALLVAFISGTYTVVPHSFGISVAVILFCCFLSSMLFPSLNKEV